MSQIKSDLLLQTNKNKCQTTGSKKKNIIAAKLSSFRVT